MSANDSAFTCHSGGVRKARDLAIDEGWCPSFWDGDREITEAACHAWQSRHLDFNEEYGDVETKVVPCLFTR
jgi:hypothetical protein